MRQEHLCITIDGASACGKSTTAQNVAKSLGLMHLDTGAIYRSMAFWLRKKGVPIEDEAALQEALRSFTYEVKQEGEEKRHYVAGEDVTAALRTNEISNLASKISALPWVREASDKIQREIAGNVSIVVDGRDAGTKVFPNADVKIFLTASLQERARRRLEELKGRGLSLEEVQKEIEERDARDKQRAHAPLKKPIGAVTIDTTHKTSQEVVDAILALITEKQKSKKKSSSFVYRMTRAFLYGLFRLCYRIRVRGLENCPEGGAIVASNHVSFLDPPAIGLMWPHEMHFLAQEYLFRNPFFRFFLRIAHSHPISRSVKDIQVMKGAVSLLHQGNALLIFPEGTRSYDGALLPLRPGIVLLASLSNKPVVPTYIRGAYKIWPRKNKLPKPFGRIEVCFGTPLFWSDYEKEGLSKKEVQEAFLHALEESIRALLKDR
jgi:cytidylate kinase